MATIARRYLRAKPVYLAVGETVEFVPSSLAMQHEFSPGVLGREEKIRTSFVHMEAADALRRIATAVKADIVIPVGVQGIVDGPLEELTWEGAIQRVLEISGNKGKVKVLTNNLVEIR